ncbi:uncharacterized protein C19orf47 homolog isoform X1 [Clupea harengus]|uniref:Uncharacterized protein C19orf47 homolog isoform X1 n=1 Tax=Clupea harengus TaxID=7950 RepID=A0A6P3W2I7_CLUHA|nr:uncharacterized protein C19orf47 homolog isoform X1 [Clupea harengus]
MASEKSATSEWIQFFKEAGIPPSLAINYAVSFVDNRIQKNMLMDLSKDIMMDLGITVIGDIIAILKHAKLVYRQDMCKMATEAISSGQTSIQAELRRTANTPATRMIASALSRDSPPSTPAQWPSENRLSVTVSNKGAKGSTASSEPAAEGGNGLLVKRRRVTAEMEGKYIINMPKGTTPRTRRILGQQTKKEKGLKRTSVFARLGAESKADTTSTVAAKVSKPSGVFSRLGGGQEDPGWQRDAPKPTAAAAEEEADSDGEGSVLQYAGVLKRSHPSTKKEPAAIKPVVIKPASFALSRLGKKVKMPSIEPPPPLPSSTSSTHEGGPKRSILQRLGKAPNSGSISLSASATPLLSDALPLASPKVSSSTSAAGSADCPNAQMDAEVVSVFKRLGSKKT